MQSRPRRKTLSTRYRHCTCPCTAKRKKKKRVIFLFNIPFSRESVGDCRAVKKNRDVTLRVFYWSRLRGNVCTRKRPFLWLGKTNRRRDYPTWRIRAAFCSSKTSQNVERWNGKRKSDLLHAIARLQALEQLVPKPTTRHSRSPRRFFR